MSYATYFEWEQVVKGDYLFYCMFLIILYILLILLLYKSAQVNKIKL